MSQIQAVFHVVAPVFLLVLLGYFAVKRHLFSADAADALLKFVNWFATPALLFRATSRIDLGAAFDPRLIASFYLGSTTVFFLSIYFARRFFARRPGESVAVGFTATFSNTVFLGIPIVTRAFGEGAHGPLFAIIALHPPILYCLGMVTMETVARDGAGPFAAAIKALKGLIRNPLVIGILLGFAVNLSGVALPGPIEDASALLAQAVLPTALFGMGAALTRYAVKDQAAEAMAMVAMKLIAYPVCVYILAYHVFVLPHEMARVAVTLSSMPGGLNIYLFAMLYGRGQATAASAMLLGTAISVVTIPIWLTILG